MEKQLKNMRSLSYVLLCLCGAIFGILIGQLSK